MPERAGKSVDRYSYYRGKSGAYIAHDDGGMWVETIADTIRAENHALRLCALANDMLTLHRRSLWQRLRWALRPTVSEP